MRLQMERLTFGLPMHGISSVALDFVERMGEVVPGTLKYVKPLCGGSEAVEAALKFVRQYYKQSGSPAKSKFISRYNSYHGATFGAMSASGNGRRKSKFEPQMSGFLKVFRLNHYRDSFGSWDEANRFAAESVEDIVLQEDPETIAGVLVGAHRQHRWNHHPDSGIFEIVRTVCNRHNVV